ncbi:hypothetical protein BKA66DRAFT_200043 [Pyrenochaeta sp. MPI-SDFR-AT-0127]|nr:hypothetical protein BKA66DRAFT_200043 [Pyrenochaeta sp. MPI-SDFR-AT-0127]
MPEHASPSLDDHASHDSGMSMTDFDPGTHLQTESNQLSHFSSALHIPLPTSPFEIPLPPSRPASSTASFVLRKIPKSHSCPSLVSTQPVPRGLSPVRGRRTPKLISAPAIQWATTSTFAVPVSPIPGSEGSRGSTSWGSVGSGCASPSLTIPSLYERQIRSTHALSPLSELSSSISSQHRTSASRSPAPSDTLDVYSVFSLVDVQHMPLRSVTHADIAEAASAFPSPALRGIAQSRFWERFSLDGPAMYGAHPDPMLGGNGVEELYEKLVREVEGRTGVRRSRWRARVEKVWRKVLSLFGRGRGD